MRFFFWRIDLTVEIVSRVQMGVGAAWRLAGSMKDPYYLEGYTPQEALRYDREDWS